MLKLPPVCSTRTCRLAAMSCALFITVVKGFAEEKRKSGAQSTKTTAMIGAMPYMHLGASVQFSSF
jgi:hypothetical protein